MFMEPASKVSVPVLVVIRMRSSAPDKVIPPCVLVILVFVVSAVAPFATHKLVAEFKRVKTKV